MSTIYMYDVPKSWSDDLVGLLLNKTVIPSNNKWRHTSNSSAEEEEISCTQQQSCGSTPMLTDGVVCIERLRYDKPPDCGKYAQVKLTFPSIHDLEWTVQGYQSIAVPMTHGYHHFSFSFNESMYEPYESGTLSCHNYSCSFPPLHLQLMALSTTTLEERITKLKSDRGSNYFHLELEPNTTSAGDGKKKRKGPPKLCKVHRHAILAKELGSLLGGIRPTIELDGIPVRGEYSQPLLNYLQNTHLWPPKRKQRKGVNSGNYLTIRQKHPDEMNELWYLCRSLFYSLYHDVGGANTKLPQYTALAITKNFRGSPHIDQHDTTFQHVVALGAFVGGRLCVDDDRSVVSLNVKNRLGRIDGRRVHWVSGFKGERYSVVYYSTASEHFTELVDQDAHNQWMRISEN